MKKQVLVVVTLAIAILALALPLRNTFAQSVSGDGIVGQPSKLAPAQASTPVPTPDACANDTPDNQKVKGAPETDNVDLQCGDQTGPDDKTGDTTDANESADTSETGTGKPDTDNVQEGTVETQDSAQPAPAQAQ